MLSLKYDSELQNFLAFELEYSRGRNLERGHLADALREENNRIQVKLK